MTGYQRELAQEYDLRIFMAMRQIIRIIAQHSRQLMTQYQVTGPQLICLRAVAKQGPMTVGAVARHAFLSPSTVIGILDRLAQKNLIERQRDTRDRRVVRVTLTEEGRLLSAKAPMPLETVLATGIRALPYQEVIRITESVEKLVQLMGAQKVSAASVLTAQSTEKKEKPPTEEKKF